MKHIDIYKIKVLVACECSGIVSNAFNDKGFNVLSCDLKPSESYGKHYQGSVFDLDFADYDFLIGFPPCTYLSYAGNAHWENEDRVLERIKAAEFFMKLYTAPIPYICIEQPRGIMNKIFRQPDQEIHPYHFGEPVQKRTGLYLKNLKPLTYSQPNDLFNPGVQVLPGYSHVHKTRDKEKRSVFWNSIALAMADQFTTQIKNHYIKSGYKIIDNK